MITATKICTCGQKLEFDAEIAEQLTCPTCQRPVLVAPPPKEEPRAKGLFVSVGDENKGPYSLKQIRAMYESGQLTMDTLCCREGDERWRALVELENEFMASERRAAMPMYIPVPMRPPAKAKWVYIVLGLFLGLLGVHNFYAGYNERGAVQLMITILTGWLILPLFAVAFWVFIEIASTDKDAKGVRFV